MHQTIVIVSVLLSCLVSAPARQPGPVSSLPGKIPLSLTEAPKEGDFQLVGNRKAADIYVAPEDFKVAQIAAGCLMADVESVAGVKPALKTDTRALSGNAVVIGTIGRSPLIDELIRTGKIETQQIAGQWESFVIATVTNPIPGVKTALVIAGRDRRGTAYGVFTVSEAIGISPWVWWADVAPTHRDALVIRKGAHAQGPPSVKYRGIFINDEDWGLKPWAAKTFDPALGDIGPKTYARVYELMLRLRLNYLWPAMHACSREFASLPENAALADQYAIVMGAAHCEPMLQNNVWYPKDRLGPWDYSTNRENILGYWEESAKARGNYEAVWTEGIRGIHDSGMTGPRNMAGRIAVLRQTIDDQRALIEKYVTKQWGPVAQCFIPYKEVLPIFDAGLEVPPDVTLVWADDNYGYLRRLSNLQERQRPGGAGIYYHLSYYGAPQSYLWINTTPPALMWEEMRKAWDNDARTLWILNVGDIKPGEVGIEFFSRLAWNVDAFGPDAQPRFLCDFSGRVFGTKLADEIAAFYGEFYRVGQFRKMETMSPAWMASLQASEVAAHAKEWTALLEREKTLAAKIPAANRDAWTQLAGYPARMLAAAGFIFMENRLALDEPAQEQAHTNAMKHWRDYILSETKAYNEQIAGGKWRHFMPSPDENGYMNAYKWTRWAVMSWPWAPLPPEKPLPPMVPPKGQTIPAAAFTRKMDLPSARWVEVAGLGRSCRAVTLLPAIPQNAWDPATNIAQAPRLEYDFTLDAAGDGETVLSLLPTFRLYPGVKLRLAVTLDGGTPQIIEVPGSESEDENGPVRRHAVRDGRVFLRMPLPALTARKHTLKVHAVDPGAVLDEITLPGLPLP